MYRYTPASEGDWSPGHAGAYTNIFRNPIRPKIPTDLAHLTALQERGHSSPSFLNRYCELHSTDWYNFQPSSPHDSLFPTNRTAEQIIVDCHIWILGWYVTSCFVSFYFV